MSQTKKTYIFAQFLILLVVLPSQIYSINFERVNYDDDMNTRVFRSTNLGEAFYNLKMLDIPKSENQKIFDSMHLIIDQIYQFKNFEEIQSKQIKQVNDQMSSLIAQEKQDFNEFFQKNEQNLNNLIQRKEQFQDKLDDKQQHISKVKVQIDDQTGGYDDMKEGNQKDVVTINQAIECLLNLNREIQSIEPNKYKMENIRKKFGDLMNEFPILTKQQLDSKWAQAETYAEQFSSTNEKRSLSQLQDKYQEISQVLGKEKESMTKKTKADLKTQQINLEELGVKQTSIEYTISKIQDDIKDIQDDISLAQDKDDILKREQQLIQRSKFEQDQFYKIENKIYKDRMSEYDDTLSFVHMIDEFWRTPKEDIFQETHESIYAKADKYSEHLVFQGSMRN